MVDQPATRRIMGDAHTGGAKLAVMDQDIAVFASSDQVSLDGISDEIFEQRFAEYRHLLVRSDDRKVLAATRSSDRFGLRAAYLELFPGESEVQMYFKSGPLAMKANLSGGGIAGNNNGHAR